MLFRKQSGILGVACALACAAAAVVAVAMPPSAARGAIAKMNGGSGLSGTLSSNPTIRQQQLICDPDPPDVGSTSVLYNPAVSLLAGVGNGPGYGAPASGPGGYVEVFDRSSNSTKLVDMGQYLNNVQEFGHD